jgi:hypothetical protein
LKHAEKISLTIKSILARLKKAHWRGIFLSFATATIFWFFNALNKEYTSRIYYPIDIVYDRDSLIAVEDIPDEVPLSVTGGGWQLLKKTVSANVEPIRIVLDNPLNTSYLTGRSLLPEFAEQLENLDVNYVAIDTIFLNIERVVSRKLPITVDSARIQLREGHVISSDIVLEPDSITFRGPQSFIEQMADTFEIHLSDKNIDRRYDEELSMDMFTSVLIEKHPEIVHVMFDVDEYVRESATVEIEPVNFPYDSAINLKENYVNANFLVQRKRRNDDLANELSVIADLANLDPADSTITLEVIDQPAYIQGIDLEKTKVRVSYGR